MIPLQFLEGQSTESLGLTGKESYTIEVPPDLTPGQVIPVEVGGAGGGRGFSVRVRIDTEVELTYFRNGGILNYMIRKVLD